MRFTTLRFVLAALMLFAVTIVIASSAGAQSETPTTTPEAAPAPACVVTQAQHNRYARFIWKFSAYGGNFVAKHPTKRQITKLDNMRACASSVKAKTNMRSYMRSRVKQWRWYHYIDVVATPFGKWAVPASVVNCEGGPNGWTTFNHGGSGAAGPYQLLGHGAPMPATTPAAQAQHHIIAHNLYVSSGLGPWEASRSCWG